MPSHPEPGPETSVTLPLFGSLRLIALGLMGALAATLLLFILADDLVDRMPELAGGALSAGFIGTVTALHYRQFGAAWLAALGLVPFRGTGIVIGQTVALWALAELVQAQLAGSGDNGLGRQSLWGAILFTGLIGPLAEELLFRQLLFRGLMAAWGKIVPIALVTSLAWSMLHFSYDVAQQIELLIAGIYYVYLRHRFESLLAPLLSHCVHNLIIIALAWSDFSFNPADAAPV